MHYVPCFDITLSLLYCNLFYEMYHSQDMTDSFFFLSFFAFGLETNSGSENNEERSEVGTYCRLSRIETLTLFLELFALFGC